MQLTNKGHIPYFDLTDLRYDFNKKFATKTFRDLKFLHNIKITSPYPAFWLRVRRNNKNYDLMVTYNIEEVTGKAFINVWRESGFDANILFRIIIGLDIEHKHPATEYSFGYQRSGEFFPIQPDKSNETFAKMAKIYYFVLYALSIINMKNVRVVDEPCADIKRKENSYNKGKKQIIYKILLIDYKKRAYTIREAFLEPKKDIAPLSYVRQNFHHYTGQPGKKYFGKIEGEFWFLIPAHYKGKVSNGEIVKDYKVVI